MSESKRLVAIEEVWAEEDLDYESDDWGDEDELCGQWISEGTEECDFCPNVDACKEATYQSQKAQGLHSNPSKVGMEEG